MSGFAVKLKWLGNKTGSEEDVTLSAIQIFVGSQNVTEYASHDREIADHLEIPAYHLAEWLAENWWPLLWEPSKNEEIVDDPDFLARHSLLAAQQGFALPKISFVSAGDNIQTLAMARSVALADVRFLRGGETKPPRKEVQSELTKFIEGVIEQLNAGGFSATDLQELWPLIRETSSEEVLFCRCMGALGLSPYIATPMIEELLFKAVEELGEEPTMDVCLASTAESFASNMARAKTALSEIETGEDATIEPIAGLSVPADSLARLAWQRGVAAAKKVRENFGINETDPQGSNKLFELLRIDLSTTGTAAINTEEASLVGAVQRREATFRLGLLQPTIAKRRFAAARGVYAAWASSKPNSTRFLTQAVTRDQQASRAFAAELTAPFAYIRQRTQGHRGDVPLALVDEIASVLDVSSDVVRKQAQNNGLNARV